MSQGIEASVVAKNLTRTFNRRSRKSGFQSALKAFFKPSFSLKNAVSDVSFSVPEGSCVGLVGANGAGKTTLLKMASGLLHPTSGTITVLGYTPSERKHDFLKKIGMVMGQKSQLWLDLPAGDTFELLAAIYEIPSTHFRHRLSELSKLFEVEALLGVQVRKLSLGERMKLEIIASLLHEPQLLFLDEPTIGLDLVAKHTIRTFIKKYNQRHKTTILLSSHDMQDILETCDRLIVIAHGQLRFDGTLDEFKLSSQSFSDAMRELIST